MIRGWVLERWCLQEFLSEDAVAEVHWEPEERWIWLRRLGFRGAVPRGCGGGDEGEPLRAEGRGFGGRGLRAGCFGGLRGRKRLKCVREGGGICERMVDESRGRRV